MGGIKRRYSSERKLSSTATTAASPEKQGTANGVNMLSTELSSLFEKICFPEEPDNESHDGVNLTGLAELNNKILLWSGQD